MSDLLNEEKCEKCESNQNYQISWGGLICPGEKVTGEYEEHFKGLNGKLCFKVGYKSKRIITLSNKRTVDVICSVTCSGNGVPLFNCSSTEPEFSYTATNPTTAAKQIIKSICGKTRRVYGIDFFGFRRSDIIGTSNSTKVNWVGVLSYGIPRLCDPRYIYKVGSKQIRLQPGYEIIRQVSNFMIHCKITESPTGPEFLCFTADESELSKSNKPTIAMTNIFKTLGIDLTRNRSGYEFFGLNRSDVLEVLTSQMIAYKDPVLEANSPYELGTDYEPLNKMASIRKRNAGPTTCLLNTKSMNSRNNAIHKAVEFASFGDVKSKLLFFK